MACAHWPLYKVMHQQGKHVGHSLLVYSVQAHTSVTDHNCKLAAVTLILHNDYYYANWSIGYHCQ